VPWWLESPGSTYAALNGYCSENMHLRAWMRAENNMATWKCSTCGWIYDPAQGDPENAISPGTAFEDLPDSWTCPICGSGREFFSIEELFTEPKAEPARVSRDALTPESLGVDAAAYKERFENVFRVAQKLTSSLHIGEILELIRDEARVTLPQLQEACLLVVDPEAQHYTRPLHCAMKKERINCQLCKRGRKAVNSALSQASPAVCFLSDEQGGPVPEQDFPSGHFSEILFPIYEGKEPLAVLDAIAREGSYLSGKDIVLLKDLVELANNVIKNARNHWRMSQEKLTLDRILQHLRPFVPSTVQKIVDKDPAAPDLEKRDADVTVLFLDVAGYTRISETQSRDKVTFIIEKYFSSFLDIINGHGGDINETAGDGLMVVFQGQPGETALSAVTSALEIRGRTMEINEELVNRFPAVEVNMGINSGIAAVGMNRFAGVSGTRMTFTASGPVTNLAARIAAAATHGDILVGPETALRVNGAVRLFDRGYMQFKNVSEPVQVASLVRTGEGTE
jgi:class 3 adenylate cyclase/rubredoxin